MLSPSMVSLICIFDFGNGLMTLGGNNAAVSAIISDGRGLVLRAFGRTLLRAPALVTEALMIILTLSGVRMPQSLVNVLSKKGANFSNLASIYSEDKGSAADGELGSIGWMTQTYMIPGMESVIEARLLAG